MFEDSLKVVKPILWVKIRGHALYDYPDLSDYLFSTIECT